MKVGGVQEISTLDWPGRTCTVVFFQGCNLRCPWCQNPGLISQDGGRKMGKEDLREFLRKAGRLVDSVLVSGGEPTLQPDGILELAGICGELGMELGMETNGTLPHRLEGLLSHLSFVSVDVKAPLSDGSLYLRAIGGGPEGVEERVRRTLEILRDSGLPFEVRTTVVPTLNANPEIVDRLARDLRGLADSLCLLQFRPSGVLDPSYRRLGAPTREEMLSLGRVARRWLGRVRIYTFEAGLEEL